MSARKRTARRFEPMFPPPSGLRCTPLRIGRQKLMLLSFPVPATTRRIEAKLTPTERKVLAAVLRGAHNAEIARARRCAPKTIANHLWRIFKKLGVTSRRELAVHWHRIDPVEAGGVGRL